MGKDCKIGCFLKISTTILCPKMSLKCPKTRLFYCIRWVSVFWHFRSFFEQKIDPKSPRCHFFPKRIHQKNFQLKIPIFSKNDDGATWWPNSYKNILTCGQLRNTQRYQKCVRLVRAFFSEFCAFSSQQCPD